MGFWDWIFGDNPNSKESDKHTPTAAAGGGHAGLPPGGDIAAPVAVLEHEEQAAAVEKWWAPAGEALGEPPEIIRPELSTEALALENLLVSHFDGHNLTLPPLLQVAHRVRPKLNSSDCDLRKIADELSEDQVIAAAVLRMANSPLYRGLSKITALQAAVARLGIRALKTLLMHESLRSAMFLRKGGNIELARLIWCRSLASACTMRGLSEFTGVDKESAFLVGLLHDIGNVMVLRILHDDALATQYGVGMTMETFEYLCHECHQEFGELIAEAWSLPSDVKAIVCNHHVYPGPEDPLRTMRLQLLLSDMINSMLGYAPAEAYNLIESRPVRDLGLADRNRFPEFLDQLPSQVEDMVVAL